MYGVVTRNEDELTWQEFDRGFYEAKDVTGRRVEPATTGVNMVSCFGDTKAGEADPSIVAVDAAGDRATRDRPYFDWTYICPSRAAYRAEMLDVIERCAGAFPAVRLDDVGFPRSEYCRCSVCEAAFDSSPYADRRAWRASVITSFVEEAVDRIPGSLFLTLYPDPYPGHLHDRSGLDLDALSDLVDEFVVPIYDTAYGTTYWIEAIASAFSDRLATPFSVELYAVHVEVDALVRAAEVAAAYAEDVYFAYDAATARAAIQRLAGAG